ncbi:MAG: hypothetical protein WC723_05925 [Candidatus Omnitrophota bacterium]
MSRSATTPLIIVLIILALTFLSLAGGGFYLFQKERVKTLDLEQKLEELNVKQKATEAKLKESERLLADFQTRLQATKAQLDMLSRELQQEKAGRLEALTKVEQLKEDLAQQKRLRSDLENKIIDAQSDLNKTQDQLKSLTSQKDELETKIKDLEAKSKEVELGNIVVSPESKAAQQPASDKKALNAKSGGLEGKTLVVNKDYNFMVINLGSKDGVSLDDMFSVYHNNKYVGDAKVERVHDSMSAAGFLFTDMKDKVNEGDKVVQKVK